MVVNRGGFYEMAQWCGIQNEEQWTLDGALRDITAEREGLQTVAGGFNREGSGRQVGLERDRAVPETKNQDDSR